MQHHRCKAAIGAGRVFLARDLYAGGHLVALKILPGEFLEGDIVRVERGAEGLELTPVLQAQVVGSVAQRQGASDNGDHIGDKVELNAGKTMLTN